MKIKLEDRDKAAISSNPPKMPKVLDVSAVQEILGVSTYQDCDTYCPLCFTNGFDEKILPNRLITIAFS